MVKSFYNCLISRGFLIASEGFNCSLFAALKSVPFYLDVLTDMKVVLKGLIIWGYTGLFYVTNSILWRMLQTSLPFHTVPVD